MGSFAMRLVSLALPVVVVYLCLPVLLAENVTRTDDRTVCGKLCAQCNGTGELLDEGMCLCRCDVKVIETENFNCTDKFRSVCKDLDVDCDASNLVPVVRETRGCQHMSCHEVDEHGGENYGDEGYGEGEEHMGGKKLVCCKHKKHKKHHKKHKDKFVNIKVHIKGKIPDSCSHQFEGMDDYSNYRAPKVEPKVFFPKKKKAQVFSRIGSTEPPPHEMPQPPAPVTEVVQEIVEPMTRPAPAIPFTAPPEVDGKIPNLYDGAPVSPMFTPKPATIPLPTVKPTLKSRSKTQDLPRKYEIVPDADCYFDLNPVYTANTSPYRYHTQQHHSSSAGYREPYKSTHDEYAPKYESEHKYSSKHSSKYGPHGHSYSSDYQPKHSSYHGYGSSYDYGHGYGYSHKPHKHESSYDSGHSRYEYYDKPYYHESSSYDSGHYSYSDKPYKHKSDYDYGHSEYGYSDKPYKHKSGYGSGHGYEYSEAPHYNYESKYDASYQSGYDHGKHHSYGDKYTEEPPSEPIVSHDEHKHAMGRDRRQRQPDPSDLLTYNQLVSRQIWLANRARLYMTDPFQPTPRPLRDFFEDGSFGNGPNFFSDAPEATKNYDIDPAPHPPGDAFVEPVPEPESPVDFPELEHRPQMYPQASEESAMPQPTLPPHYLRQRFSHSGEYSEFPILIHRQPYQRTSVFRRPGTHMGSSYITYYRR